MQYDECMERTETVASVGRGKNTEPVVKRVLVGAWDGTKRAVESQMPAAWNERIINVINDKVIPRLTPGQVAFVSEHQEGLERGIKAASVGITVVEIYLAAVALKHATRGVKEVLRRRRMSQYEPASFVKQKKRWAKSDASVLPRSLEQVLELRYGNVGPVTVDSFAGSSWMNDLRRDHRRQFGNNIPLANQFAETIRRMGETAQSGAEPEWNRILHVTRSKRTAEAFPRIRSQFIRAFHEVAQHPSSPVHRMPFAQRNLAAHRAYEQWEAMQMPRIEDILNWSQGENRRVDYAGIAQATRRLVGERIPTELHAILDMYNRGSFTRLMYEDIKQDPAWAKAFEQTPGFMRFAMEDEAREQKALQVSLQNIAKAGGTWVREPKPTQHRFLNEDGSIKRPSTSEHAPMTDLDWARQTLDEQIHAFTTRRQEKIDRIHEIVRRTPERIVQRSQGMEIRRAMRDSRGRLEHALQAAAGQLGAVPQSSDRALLVLLDRAHDMHARDNVVQQALHDLGTGGTGITDRVAQTRVAQELFTHVYRALPQTERDALGWQHPDRMVPTLAARWVQELDRAGLDVVNGESVRRALDAMKTPTRGQKERSNPTVWSERTQMLRLMDAIKDHIREDEVAHAVQTVERDGYGMMSEHGDQGPSHALRQLLRVGLSKVPEEDWRHFGANDAITREIMAHERKRGKSGTEYLVLELAEWYVNHQAPGLGGLFRAVKHRLTSHGKR